MSEETTPRNRLKVLYLEDDELDALLALKALKEEYPEVDLHLVYSEKAFESAIRDRPYDVILSDSSVPGFDGMTALGMAKRIRPEIPYIFFSGSTANKPRAVAQGATDFLGKNDPEGLVEAIRKALGYKKRDVE
ncbi:MAG TPA: response regulator [Opitutaceae bacterium]